MNEIQKLEAEVMPVVQRAQEFTVTNAQEDEAAIEFAKELIRAEEKVHELCDPICDATNKAHKTATAQRKMLLDPILQAKKIVKDSSLAWRQAEEEKRLAEERRLQAIADEQARKEREKAEQAAAKQRAIEDEARRKAEAARAEAAKLDADTKEAARLIREAEVAERKAAAAAVKAEAKIEDAAAVMAPVIQVAKAAPVKGASVKTIWKARLVDMEELIASAAKGDSLAISFLSFNEQAAGKIATATKGGVNCPGVTFYEEKSMAVRSK